jgi:hypothetical protein
MTDRLRQRLRRRPRFWAAMFAIGVGVVAALRLTDAVDANTGFLLFVAAMGLTAPMYRALRRQNECGQGGTATLRYAGGMIVAACGYVLGLGAATAIDRSIGLGPGAAVVVALLPALPIIWMIYVMARYLREEGDEYLHHCATIAALVGLGVVLAAGSLWGFLEMFGVVPHAPGWWCVPLWAIGMALGQAWLAIRDRTGSEA